MLSLLQVLDHVDRMALAVAHELRWSPLTAVFVLLSAWWVKGPVIVAAGACADARCRRFVPLAGVSAALSVLAGAAASGLIKDVVDRLRPVFADPGVTALVTTPETPSFPSGHATTAFAAAAAVGAFHPRLRWPLYGVALLVATSRVYLGVHYGLDVLAGALLGVALGLTTAWAVRRLAATRESSMVDR